ncbi:hypothetical protein [Vogesella sp. XCS3]|uniref:hypothetical protein n=1 Tax=Vogesella sp. XCS3 TaxID=2877939 RepID=UPI001D0B1686|nr:hypothetical protein [Vogesella sp. XCS3]UDM17928.1 hypothetical protein LCH97_04495 [Vogesella sp. XCS3]
MRVFFAVAIAVIALQSGCAQVHYRYPEQTASYGQSPSNIEQQIKDRMQGFLKDPYSAQYRILSAPKKAYYNAADGGIQWTGYAVKFSVNAKNSYGAYVGEKLYVAIFNDGALGNIQDPARMEWIDGSFTNRPINYME